MQAMTCCSFACPHPGPVLAPLRLGHPTCAFKADGGPCKAIHVRYHFNIHTRQCETFEFGGCEGNENNFLTQQECQKKCIVPGQCVPFSAAVFLKLHPGHLFMLYV